MSAGKYDDCMKEDSEQVCPLAPSAASQALTHLRQHMDNTENMSKKIW
jgi:hypothetical protein